MKSFIAGIIILIVALSVCFVFSKNIYPDDELQAAVLTNRLLLGIIIFAMVEVDFRKHN